MESVIACLDEGYFMCIFHVYLFKPLFHIIPPLKTYMYSFACKHAHVESMKIIHTKETICKFIKLWISILDTYCVSTSMWLAIIAHVEKAIMSHMQNFLLQTKFENRTQNPLFKD